MRDGPAGLKERFVLVDDPGFSLLVVRPDGSALFMIGYGLPSYVNAPFYAIGSGPEYALGAMETGADAVAAVRIACKYDVYSEPPIMTLAHAGGPLRKVA